MSFARYDAAEGRFHESKARALDAMNTMVRIDAAAEGRDLTAAQSRDREAATETLQQALRGLWGDVAFADIMATHGNSIDEVRAVIEAQKSPEELRMVAASAHPKLDATGSGDDFFELRQAFRTAAEGGSYTFTSQLSPAFAERRALATSTATVPVSFADTVTVYARQLSPILGLATVVTRPSGNPVILPRLTSDPATGGTPTAEAAAISAADPTLSSVTLTPRKFASLTLWSAELEADTGIAAFGDLIAQSVARDLSLGYGALLTSGTGTTVPLGYTQSAGIAGTAIGTAVAGGASFFGWADAAKLYGTLAAPYRENASWVVSETAFAAMLQWRDASGRPLFMETTSAGAPATLLGRPVFVDPALPALGSASKSVYLGDFSRFYVYRTGLRIDVSREFAYDTDQIALRVIERLDGALIDAAAVKTMVSAAS